MKYSGNFYFVAIGKQNHSQGEHLNKFTPTFSLKSKLSRSIMDGNIHTED